MSDHLLRIEDRSDQQLRALLERAREIMNGSAPESRARHLALVFFETSLRTRVGFAAAAQRLGWAPPIEVSERRGDARSMPESVEDTIAVMSAYFDTLVVRLDRPISSIMGCVLPDVTVVNGGDRGVDAEHPTQALIDFFAMQQLVGQMSDLHVAVVGDLRMRSARSLLRLLARMPPGRLTLVTDDSLTDEGRLADAVLGDARIVHDLRDVTDVDAVLAVGIPHGGATEDVRARLRVDGGALNCLSVRGRVFSPMPVIDEVAFAVRNDPRVAFLAQSALGLPVRMAALESLRD